MPGIHVHHSAELKKNPILRGGAKSAVASTNSIQFGSALTFFFSFWTSTIIAHGLRVWTLQLSFSKAAIWLSLKCLFDSIYLTEIDETLLGWFILYFFLFMWCFQFLSFLTERIVYFLNTVHCYKIWKNTVIMKYKYKRRCVNLLLKRVIVG